MQLWSGVALDHCDSSLWLGQSLAGKMQVGQRRLDIHDAIVIVTVDPAFFASIRGDASWSGIRAVRSGRVYLAPLVPFPWLDFPPLINRLIGLRWLGLHEVPDGYTVALLQFESPGHCFGGTRGCETPWRGGFRSGS